MTQSNKLKKKIRARAQKTGESYAAAREHVLVDLDKKRTHRTQKTVDTARQSPAKGAVSEKKCIEQTGHGFDHWFAVLDRFGAPQKGHRLSAKHLTVDHNVSAWYAQSLTVMYERAKGLREVNQSCEGDFQFSLTRVVPTSVETSRRAVALAAGRRGWIEDVPPPARPVVEPALHGLRFKAARGGLQARVKTDHGTVVVEIMPKPNGRSQLGVHVNKLSSQKERQAQQAVWRAGIDALAAHLKQKQAKGA